MLSSLPPCPADHRELRAAGRFNEIETCAIRFTHLARDVQTEPAPSGRSGEKRLEELAPQFRRHAGTIVHHVQFYSIALAFQADDDTDARLLPPAVPERVAAEIPHHLIELPAVEQHAWVGLEFDRESLRADLF